MNNSAFAYEIAKTVRDFEHYFGTLDNPKLEEWIEDTLNKGRAHGPGDEPRKTRDELSPRTRANADNVLARLTKKLGL